MGKSIMTCFGTRTVTDNTTRHIPIVGEIIAGSDAEASYQIPMRDAGLFRNLLTYVPTNDISVSPGVVISLRINLVTMELAVTYNSNQTGVKENTLTEEPVIATDEVNWIVVCSSETGTNLVTITMVSVEFEPDAAGDTLTKLACAGVNDTNSSASFTFYQVPCQRIVTAGSGTEANAKWRARAAFTMSDLYTYVAGNGRTTDTTIKTRKNGANGGQSVTYTSGQTGVKEDTTGTDSIASGDDFCYSMTTGSGTGGFTSTVISVTCISTAGSFPLLNGLASGNNFDPNATYYEGVMGSLVGEAVTQINAQTLPRFNFTARNLGVMVVSNPMTTGTCAFTLQSNGSDTGLSVSYAVAETGLKEDTDSVAIIGGTDEINYAIVNTDLVGACGATWIAILGEVAVSSVMPPMERDQFLRTAPPRAITY